MVKDAIALYPMYALPRRGASPSPSSRSSCCLPRVVQAARPAATCAWGLLAGVFLSAGYIFQTWGLDGATATTPARPRSSPGMFVVITPLLQAVLLRKMPRKATLAGRRDRARRAVAALRDRRGERGMGARRHARGALRGRVLGAHDRARVDAARRHDVMALTLVQLATVAVVCAVDLGGQGAARACRPTRGHLGDRCVTGVLASAVAFVGPDVRAAASSRRRASRSS